MNRNLEVIILAAGLGTRMKSATVKVLHRAAGRPIIDYVVDLASQVSDKPPIVVVGHQREAVQKWLGDLLATPCRRNSSARGTPSCRRRRFSGKLAAGRF